MKLSLQSAMIERLRQQRGTFDERESIRIWETILALVLIFPIPILFFIAPFVDGVPIAEWNFDYWASMVCGLLSFFLGAFIFYYIGGQYEFTGHGIILRRRGLERMRIQFEDVKTLEFQTTHYGHRFFILDTGRQRMSILLYPELQRAIVNPGS